MSSTSAPKQEKDYQAENDARTLTEAAKISQDARRLTAARKCLAKDHQAVMAADKFWSGPQPGRPLMAKHEREEYGQK